ncbi:hypothetical protein LNTAR_14822 [Lentisphaera araneosa HTCC2155]|uniref:Uncharacterized protein n=1 Tax=Lentisphaera araneosa HTCC2155 TaxID=313628 RepID=A6DHL6_9BACT|nr:hypothetical protein [Lentisphaera araneosa]EDM29099.1 hypothetical protein LNTAR_14822 [Lentisphaera araneosa HTCC2155]
MKNLIYTISAIVVILIVISPKLFTSKDQITTYIETDQNLDAPKANASAAPRAPSMMSQAKAENGGLIALIANTPKYTWFVKIIGPYQAVKKQVDNLDLVIKTLDLSHGDHLHYDIPKDWTKKQASSMRVASFDAPGGVDISFSKLPAGQSLNANVVRWKKQIGLSGDPTEEELSEVKENWHRVILFNEDRKDMKAPKESKSSQSPHSSSAPFASGMAAVADDANSIMAAIIERPDATWFLKLIGPAQEVRVQADNIITVIGAHSFTAEGKLEYPVPTDWKEVPSSSSMRIASYKTGKVDISLIKLGPKQNIDANVSRWKGQIGLDTQVKVENEIKSFNIQGNTIHIVKLINDNKKVEKAPEAPKAPVAKKVSEKEDCANCENCASKDQHKSNEAKLETLQLNPSDKWKQLSAADGMSLGKYEMKLNDSTYGLSITQMQGPMPMERVYNMWFDQMGLKGQDPNDYIEKVKSSDNKDLDLIKISNDKEILISASFQGTSKIFFKVQGPASQAEEALSEFKSLITSARFE